MREMKEINRRAVKRPLLLSSFLVGEQFVLSVKILSLIQGRTPILRTKPEIIEHDD